MKKRMKGDLIRYMYQEMNALESKLFEQDLQQDPEMAREHQELSEAKQSLDTIRYKPSYEILKKLQEYAAK